MENRHSLLQLTDQELIKTIEQGNVEAFQVLVEKYKKVLYKVCHRLTNDTEDAKDLLQSTYLKAIVFISTGRYVQRGNFFGWLGTIARNTYVDECRKKQALTIIDIAAIDHGDIHHLAVWRNSAVMDVESLLVEKEFRELIKSLIKDLNPQVQKIIMLRWFQEYKYVEIAEELGIKIGTVKRHLFNARTKISRQLMRVAS